MPNLRTKTDLNNNEIVFWLNAKNYPLEAIYSAAYVFVDRAYIFLDGDPKKEIEIHLKGKEKMDKKKLEDMRGEFLNEMLNILLRKSVSRENKKTFEFIVAGAVMTALERNENDQTEDSEMRKIEEEIARFKEELGLGKTSGYEKDPLNIRAASGPELNPKKKNARKKRKK